MPNEQDRTPGRRPRVRSLRFVATVVLAALLTPIAAFIGWSRIEAARLDRALDSLEARREPLDVAEFETKPTTDAQREASHLYARAGRLAGDRPLTAAQLADAGRIIDRICAPEADVAALSDDVRALRTLEEPYTAALEMLDRATALDASGWDDADRPPRYSLEDLRSRNLARLNALRIARLACADKDAHRAASALLATLRLRRVLLLSFSVVPDTAHGLQSLLTWTSPAPPLLQALQTEYDNQIDEHSVETRVRYQRAQWLSFTLPGVLSDPPPGYTGARITPFGAMAMRLARPMRDRAIVHELREFDDALAAANQPWPARLEASTGIANRFRYVASQSRRVGLFRWLMQSFNPHLAGGNLETTVIRAAETLARARASAAAIAVARYRLAHDGTLPASLRDLQPQYLAGPPLDPYTAAALKYVRQGQSFKVYSVGMNRQDDGGEWEGHSDLQSARRGYPADIGVAVGPAASRRR